MITNGQNFVNRCIPQFYTKKIAFELVITQVFGDLILFTVSLKYQVKENPVKSAFFFLHFFTTFFHISEKIFHTSKFLVSLFCCSWIVVGGVTNAVKDGCAALAASKLVAYGNPWQRDLPTERTPTTEKPPFGRFIFQLLNRSLVQR